MVERPNIFAERDIVWSQQLTRGVLRVATFYFVKDIVDFIFGLTDYWWTKSWILDEA